MGFVYVFLCLTYLFFNSMCIWVYEFFPRFLLLHLMGLIYSEIIIFCFKFLIITD
jgi:hypothetical protein